MRQAQDIVPGLQQEYDELMAELAKEKTEVAELEGCDQNYLNELKATIAEQRCVYIVTSCGGAFHKGPVWSWTPSTLMSRKLRRSSTASRRSSAKSNRRRKRLRQ
jgi:hypothetical protein